MKGIRIDKIMNEIWKDIEGYEGFYKISNFGRVKSLKRKDTKGRTVRERILKPCIVDGYYSVTLYKDIRKIFKIHRLIAMAFIPNIENKPFINHIDGNKKNNSIDNLEWVTNQENIKHAFKIGLIKGRKGKFNPMYGKKFNQEHRDKIGKSRDYKKAGDHILAKKVRCITTNEVFDCIKSASETYKVDKSSISKCCKGKQRTAGKHPVTNESLTWEYLIYL